MKLDATQYEILYRIPFDKTKFLTAYPPVLKDFIIESDFIRMISAINRHIKPRSSQPLFIVSILSLLLSVATLALFLKQLLPLWITICCIILFITFPIIYIARYSRSNPIVSTIDVNKNIDLFNKNLLDHEITLSLVGNFTNNTESPTYLIVWVKKRKD